MSLSLSRFTLPSILAESGIISSVGTLILLEATILRTEFIFFAFSLVYSSVYFPRGTCSNCQEPSSPVVKLNSGFSTIVTVTPSQLSVPPTFTVPLTTGTFSA